MRIRSLISFSYPPEMNTHRTPVADYDQMAYMPTFTLYWTLDQYYRIPLYFLYITVIKR